MGEAINLVENFNVEKAIFNCGKFNDLEQELIKVLDKKKTPYYSCIKELKINDKKDISKYIEELYYDDRKECNYFSDKCNCIINRINAKSFDFF